MWQSVEILSVFNTLTFKQIFWKTKAFFKKLEYSFFVESTKIENALFPYKTGISDTRMVSTKWTYHKELLPVTTLFFWNFCFSLRTSYKELIWRPNHPNVHIRIFCKRWSFIWRCFFPVSIFNLLLYLINEIILLATFSTRNIF